MRTNVTAKVTAPSYKMDEAQAVYFNLITPTPLSPLLLRGELVRPSVP